MRARLIVGALSLVVACGDPSPAWHSVGGDLDRAALAVSGRGDADVFIVGGPLGAGNGSLALHYDGEAWRELATNSGDVTLWWVWPDPASNQVWMVGEGGTVLRGDGTTFETIASGTTTTLFGVWGSSANDVWIVGGDAVGNDEDDVVLHWDGSTLERVTVPTTGVALFKVWGASAGEVFIAGQGGTMLHYTTAGGWENRSADLATTSSLLTVHGCSGSEVYAVGGRVVYTFDGTSWSAATGVEILGIANGVSCAEDSVLVVGNAGLKLRMDRSDGTWTDDQFQIPFDQDLHGAWVSPSGDLWATGGNFNIPASLGPRIGTVGFWGTDPPPTM